MAATASYLDARRHGGLWQLRIDDIDPARTPAGAIDAIPRVLEAFALHWDGPIRYQSRRLGQYREALRRLQSDGWLYQCACTRRQLRRDAPHGPLGPVYPGTCRTRGLGPSEAATVRFRLPEAVVEWHDGLQPTPGGSLTRRIGDVIVQRTDGWPSYHLATAIDDARPGISHVLRGADLIWCTPVQIAIMTALGLRPPRYLHLPLALAADGSKLSKQTGAEPLAPEQAPERLWSALRFLGLPVPDSLAGERPEVLLHWAVGCWRTDLLSAGNRPAPASLR